MFIFITSKRKFWMVLHVDGEILTERNHFNTVPKKDFTMTRVWTPRGPSLKKSLFHRYILHGTVCYSSTINLKRTEQEISWSWLITKSSVEYLLLRKTTMYIYIDQYDKLLLTKRCPTIGHSSLAICTETKFLLIAIKIVWKENLQQVTILSKIQNLETSFFNLIS